MGSGGIAPQFLISAQVRGQWPASDLDRLTLGKEPSSIHWMGDSVDPRVGLNLLKREKYFVLAKNGTPAFEHVSTDGGNINSENFADFHDLFATSHAET